MRSSAWRHGLGNFAMVLVVAAGSALVFPSPLDAQLPATQLDGIYPAGANPGATVEVTVVGSDLDDVDQLHFTHPGITAKLKTTEPGMFDKGPQPVLNTFLVTVAGNVPLGAYDVRARGKYGISNPRVFEIGSLPEMLETEPNQQPAEDMTLISLPSTINGQINGATDVDLFKFRASRGQRLLLECRGSQLDSPLDPVVTLCDAAGRELLISREGHAGEPLVDFTPPADGDYFVKVTDSLYRGGPGYVYRLSIGPAPHIDFVFPPAGLPGSNGPFTVFGRNLPGGKPVDLTIDGYPLQQLTVNVALPGDPAAPLPYSGRLNPHQAFVDGIEYRVQGSGLVSNPARIGFATAPPVIEVEPNNQPAQAQAVAAPCEIQGQFLPQRDNDWFAFEAKKDETFSIELYSNRLGAPTDPLLVIQQVTTNDKGEEQVRVLATADDSGHQEGGPEFDLRSGDPVYRLVAPADATYRVQVRDGFSALRSDPRLVYRLAIRSEQPDFRLVAVPADSARGLMVRKGGREAITVVAERRDNFDGEITVTVKGLPAGVTASEVVIGPAVNATTLVLSAAENAADAVATIEIVGTAEIGGKAVTRTARCAAATVAPPMRQPNQQLVSVPSRVSRQIVMAVSAGETAPVAFQTEAKVWETARAGILKIPFTATRRDGYKGAIATEVRHLPANVNRVNFSIGGNQNAGEMTINLRNNTPTGTYTLHVGGFLQNVSYSRNPEAAKAAAERKAEVDKIATETAAASKAAADAKTKADKVAADNATALKTAQTEKEQADKAAAELTAALTAAEQAAKQAQAAAAANKEDKALADAATAAQKKVTDTAAQLKTAQEKVVAAEKKLATATALAKTADEEKEIAAKAAEEAAAVAKEAAQLKTETDKRATDTANAAKPKNLRYWIHSTPLTIKITPAPVTLGKLPDNLTVKQGEKIEVPVSITRLYSYAEQVTLSAAVPGGVGGLQIPNAPIPKGQQNAKLAVTAAQNATPGKHELTLRATMNFNNQGLTIEQPLVLNVEKVEEAAK